jgi:hypothetical protein
MRLAGGQKVPEGRSGRSCVDNPERLALEDQSRWRLVTVRRDSGRIDLAVGHADDGDLLARAEQSFPVPIGSVDGNRVFS